MPPQLLRGDGQARQRFVLGKGVHRKDAPPTPLGLVDISNEKGCERRFWRSVKGKELCAQEGEIYDSEGVRGGEKCAGKYGEQIGGWSGGVTDNGSTLVTNCQYNR
jgi:hypothetical protein